MSILTIPRELQLYICGLLPVSGLLTLSETCHRLKDLARDPFLWKKLTLTYNKIKNNTKACRDHIGRCSNLSDLYITGQETSIRNYTTISVVFKGRQEDNNNEEETSLHCSLPFCDYLSSVLGPLLTDIDIGNQHLFTNDDLINFVSKCSKLKYANFEDTQIEDSTLLRLARDCPELEHLDISNCREITLEGVEEFLIEAAEKKLERLDFRDCGFLSNENEYSESLEESLQTLEEDYPNIEIVYYDD